MAQPKLYRLGMKRKGGKTVVTGLHDGRLSARQSGKTHAVKNRVTPHQHRSK